MNLSPTLAMVVYAGLFGTVVSLFVATATNRWSLRVFFLLALRLAIGWHFMFEGFHKIHSTHTGPTDTNRPFSSEPYFKVAPGPLGEKMRKEFSDPALEIALKVKAPKEINKADFAKLSNDEQAAACPEAVAAQLDALQSNALETAKAEAEKELKDADTNEAKEIKDADETEQKALKGELSQDDIARFRTEADGERRKTRTSADGKREQIRERLATREKVLNDVMSALKAQPNLLGALGAQPDGAALAAQLEVVLKTFKTQANDDLKSASAAEKKALDGVAANEQRLLKAEWTESEKAAIRAKAETARKQAKEKAEKNRQEAKAKADAAADLAPKRVVEAKAAYARWVYGVEPRAAQIKTVTGEVLLTAPQRLEYVEWVKHEAKTAADRQTDGLGNGTGTDSKRVAEFRTNAMTAEADLARDANAFIAELKKDLNGGTAVEEKQEPSRGQRMDKVTMWFLVVVGSCVMFGLFTRLACVLACGFLVMTYLAHPAFPWYPLPPNTEGNPVFVNKNVIEAIALLALACYPTGRWLGLDALVLRPFCKYKPEQPA